jgi:hypothetical protein
VATCCLPVRMCSSITPRWRAAYKRRERYAHRWVSSAVTRRQYEGVRKAAVAKWLRYMEQTGWRLVSEVLDFPAKRRTAMATNGHWYGVPLLDEVEIPVAAYFKKLDLQVQRVEVPVADDDED